MNTLSQILKDKIVAIIRGANPDDVLKIAEALHSGGVKVLEVTLNSDNALELIKQLSETLKDKMLIGAGTVLNEDATRLAISAGAKFIISPNTNVEVIKVTKQLGAVSIPGAFSPTEIVNAYYSGGDIIKVFPASANVNYIREIRAPLPHIPLMPTGGITLENIEAFHKAGAVAFGIGTALVNTKLEITKDYLDQLRTKARQFVQHIAGF
ncbi:MAG: bifunctional 4-hydroxy-2-oxoglutarate aldolase/2-dehydro-3-deoxy-phosphogluconate aldolase [Bacteroidia bacterium]|nr:bifunctional 4-hydroxy-2-oxoglutarate aldolase/2-dehydro-3-deoxy-phosphogluconate aldolase [Bacteroidia bacterium]